MSTDKYWEAFKRGFFDGLSMGHLRRFVARLFRSNQ